MESMEKFEVKKVAGPLEGGAAVFLASKKKAFVIFVGLFEATAIVKELQKQTTVRPLTHDLLQNIMVGFDIELKKVIISKILDNTFCATLILEQKILEADGQWKGRRNEVYVDARASDSIVMALKMGKEIWVTKEVYDNVEDVSNQLEFLEKPPEPPKQEPWEDTDIGDAGFDFPENK